MKIILCGTPRANAVTLAAFSSHQNTDKAFTPLQIHTIALKSFVERSQVDENFVFPEPCGRVYWVHDHSVTDTRRRQCLHS